MLLLFCKPLKRFIKFVGKLASALGSIQAQHKLSTMSQLANQHLRQLGQFCRSSLSQYDTGELKGKSLTF